MIDEPLLDDGGKLYVSREEYADIQKMAINLSESEFVIYMEKWFPVKRYHKYKVVVLHGGEML